MPWLVAAPAKAELPSYRRMIEAFDKTALSAPSIGAIRKWNRPIRYRIDGMLYDKTRIAAAIAAIEKLGRMAGVQVAPAAEGEPENYLLMFHNVASFDVPGFGKASCIAFTRAPEHDGFAIRHVRLEINLAADPNISRCIFHEGMHGLGFLGHPDKADSVLNYSTRNRVEPTDLDELMIRLLYDPRLRLGMGRLPALLAVHEILAKTRPDAVLPTDYLDEIVAGMKKAAEQGNRSAQRQLAEAYRHGYHVPVDVAAAERWEAMLTIPVTSGVIPLDDPRYLPFSLGGTAYEGYRKFIARTDRPRAFVMSSSGGWGWQSGRSNAEERALARCQQENVAKCIVYAVNDAVVWKPARQGPYGDEDVDWGIPATDQMRRADQLYGPTPRQHAKAPRLLTDMLLQMQKEGGKPVLIDTTWGDHWSLPGAFQINSNEMVEMVGREKESLLKTLETLRDGDESRPLVVFSASSFSWAPYNMVLRLSEAGVKNIYWYRGGIAAWRAAGQTVDWPSVVEPF